MLEEDERMTYIFLHSGENGLSWENTSCGESMDCDDEPFCFGPISLLFPMWAAEI